MAIHPSVSPGSAALALPSLDLPSLLEAELVRHAQRGHRGAFDELLRRHRQSAYLLALQLLGNCDDALDVTQEALLRFFTTLGRFDRQRPVRPWLLRIVRNQVVDLWRRRRVREADSLDDETGVPLEIADDAADPEAMAQRRQLQRRVWRGICRLPAAKREILVLRDFHDLSYAEIAQVLNIPLGTVMSRLHGARQQLREILLEQDPASAVSTESGIHSEGAAGTAGEPLVADRGFRHA